MDELLIRFEELKKGRERIVNELSRCAIVSCFWFDSAWPCGGSRVEGSRIQCRMKVPHEGNELWG